MATRGTTMRVSTETRDRLTRLARRRGRSNEQLLEELVAEAEGHDRLEAFFASFAAMGEAGAATYRVAHGAWESAGLDEGVPPLSDDDRAFFEAAADAA